MATRDEIIAAIRQGEERVARTFGGLTDAQLATRVHEGEGGWTAKEVLAHLAGRQQGYDRTYQLAESGPPPPGSMAGFSVDDWNRQRIAERSGKSRDDLLAEFRQVHDALIARVRETPDDLLQRPIPRAQGPVPFGDALAGGGGRHALNHSAEVERALGLPEPS
ncbi:MAG TPA: DinB family protein [Thermomicrobiales bacterium]|nr:DinB family protein [Thermomicrobiales bacterium]